MDSLQILKDGPLTLARGSGPAARGGEQANGALFSRTLKNAIAHETGNEPGSEQDTQQSPGGRQGAAETAESGTRTAAGGKRQASVQEKADTAGAVTVVAEDVESSASRSATEATASSADTAVSAGSVESAEEAEQAPLPLPEDSNAEDLISSQTAPSSSSQDGSDPQPAVTGQKIAGPGEEIVVPLHNTRMQIDDPGQVAAAAVTDSEEPARTPAPAAVFRNPGEAGTSPVPANSVAANPVPENSLGYLQSVLKRFSGQRDGTGHTEAAREPGGRDGAALLKASDTVQHGGRKEIRIAGMQAASTFELPTAHKHDTVRIQYSPQPVLAPELDGPAPQELSEPAPLRESVTATLNQLTESRGAQRPAAPPLQLYSQQEAGTESWNRDIGAKITWLSSQRITKAEISLHPAELGALDITIDTDSDRISITITTRNDAARELLESSMPRLSELLRNSGLTLEQGSVNQQKASPDGQGSGRLAGDGASGNPGDPGEEEQRELDLVTRRMSLHNGQVDHYV